MKTLSLLAIATLLLGCSTESKEIPKAEIRPVKLIEISNPSAVSIRGFPAKIAATKQAELAFRVPGQLLEFSLVEGQKVNKGDVLAHLDDRDARNALLNREADFELASADYRRKGELFNRKLISQAEYDLAKAQLKSATAVLENAKDQLSYTQLSAPYAGTIAKVDIENFQMVQANQTILLLQKDSEIDVVIQVPGSLVSTVIQLQVVNGSQGEVRFANQPNKTYRARLKEYATQVTPGTQSYQVVFTLPQPTDIKILPGMSAELMLNIADNTRPLNRAVLPASAIMKRDADGQHIIWIYDDAKGIVSPSVVKLGKVTSEGIEILTGINTGDKVVVAGVLYLSDGLRVKPLRWQRGV